MTLSQSSCITYQYAGEWYAIYRNRTYRVISGTAYRITVCALPIG